MAKARYNLIDDHHLPNIPVIHTLKNLSGKQIMAGRTVVGTHVRAHYSADSHIIFARFQATSKTLNIHPETLLQLR